MSDSAPGGDVVAGRVAANRSEVEEIRRHARQLFDGGSTGLQVAAWICDAMESLIVRVFAETVRESAPPDSQLIEHQSALIAVGGTGRGDLAPYSDTDLLFLYRGTVANAFVECTSRAVREYWDAGIKLGHSVRTLGESVSMARQELQVATAAVESRLLWGDKRFFEQFQQKISRRVVHSRVRAFMGDCIAAREKERNEHGSAIQQLEPDVKRSPGGLRDVHLIRWLGFCRFGSPNLDSLRLKGALSKADSRRLVAAYEFLTRVRIDLHFSAGKPQDVLTREEQLRMAEEHNVAAGPGQRSVERFMQTYFRHSTCIADIAERFMALHRPRSVRSSLVRFLMSHHADGIFKVGHGRIDVLPRHRESLSNDLEQILKLYRAAALYGAIISPELVELIKQNVPQLDAEISGLSSTLFLDILSRSGSLGVTLRGMYNIGVLELLVPEMAHARCLLQFNQYHSFTVDEHTLRALEAAEQFNEDTGPLGTAYRAVHRKEILHLALLLHDLGKGYEEDHSDVGKRIAERTADRLNLSSEDRETLVFLVHQHLKMAHLAFRRDTSNLELLLDFGRDVGSPETLRMLYVLTAADIMAVGPGRWTEWKAELLTGLFDRAMLILSGKHHMLHEEERIGRIKQHVRKAIVPVGEESVEFGFFKWIDENLEAFPTHYLSVTNPDRIAADLDVVQQRESDDLYIEGRQDPDTGIVEYRIITHESFAAGCFHKTTGALTARHLEILSANICTSLDGIVIDAYRVIDNDFSDNVPHERFDEIAAVIRSVLTAKIDVEQLFKRHRRFQTSVRSSPVSNLPMRVALDNHSSDHCTIIDVFAHDRSGLLYTLTRAIYELDLSVALARIATHLDQIVDIFYVTDLDGRKIQDPERLQKIQRELTEKLGQFQQQGYLLFAS